MNSADNQQALQSLIGSDLFKVGYFVFEVLDVATRERLAENLVEDGNKVMKGADVRKRETVPIEPMSYGEQQGRSDSIEGNLAATEIGCELPIGAAESTGCVRELSVEMADSMNVGLFGHDYFFRRAAISLSLSRTR